MRLNRRSKEYRHLLTTLKSHGGSAFLSSNTGERCSFTRAVGKKTRTPMLRRMFKTFRSLLNARPV